MRSPCPAGHGALLARLTGPGITEIVLARAESDSDIGSNLAHQSDSVGQANYLVGLKHLRRARMWKRHGRCGVRWHLYGQVKAPRVYAPRGSHFPVGSQMTDPRISQPSARAGMNENMLVSRVTGVDLDTANHAIHPL